MKMCVKIKSKYLAKNGVVNNDISVHHPVIPFRIETKFPRA